MSFVAVAVGGASLIGGLTSAVIGSNAANNAASTQSNAAITAANIQSQSAAQALQFQRDQFNTSQNNIAPWLQTGSGALANLSYLLGINPQGNVPGTGTTQFTGPNGQNTVTTPGVPLSSTVNPNIGAFGSLAKSPDFVAPTAATEQNDPGYQFRLAQGMKALEGSAAAKGNLITGGTAKAEQQFGQDYASNEYGNVYNRALQSYNLGLTNSTNEFNKFAALAGVGQQAANTITQAGTTAANNSSTIALDSGNAQASGINNAAAATASGYYNGANALSGALTGLGSNVSQLALLNKLLAKPPASGGIYGGTGTSDGPDGWEG